MSGPFSFFRGARSNIVHKPSASILPSLELEADKNVYRSRDSLSVTIKVSVPSLISGTHDADHPFHSFLIERLTFEIKGIEKLDTQWFITQKPSPASKKRRGERVFMEGGVSCVVSNQIVSSGVPKTYVVRTLLPGSIPPSYRGTAIRYMYLYASTLSGKWLVSNNGSPEDSSAVEARVPFDVWADGLHFEEFAVDDDGRRRMDMYLKSGEGWVRAADDASQGTPSSAISSQGPLYHKYSAEAGDLPVVPKSGPLYTPNGLNEAGEGEGFVQGRSYNIIVDDEILLRFCAKKSGTNYCFGDAIGGTLLFMHGASWRCLEMSVALEISETVNALVIHPSRRHSHTTTKVVSDNYQVVRDVAQTAFLFSIPMDGPMSFSTPHISVAWALHFDFFVTTDLQPTTWTLPILVRPPSPQHLVNHSHIDDVL